MQTEQGAFELGIKISTYYANDFCILLLVCVLQVVNVPLSIYLRQTGLLQRIEGELCETEALGLFNTASVCLLCVCMRTRLCGCPWDGVHFYKEEIEPVFVLVRRRNAEENQGKCFFSFRPHLSLRVGRLRARICINKGGWGSRRGCSCRAELRWKQSISNTLPLIVRYHLKK